MGWVFLYFLEVLEMNKSAAVIILLLTSMFIFGCSSGEGMDVTMPEEPSAQQKAESIHYLWGLWQFTADPNAGTLEVVPVRMAEMHLNALPFLEPPPYMYLTLEGVEFEGNLIIADIGLRHPFLGLTQFSGFDVAGVFITNGSISGFNDPDLVMAGEGDTRLLNPDGYSRWWNPVEFPVNDGTIFGYTDGLLGQPDSLADFNSTLNGYKYFADDLDPGDPLSAVDIANRGLFSPGQKNVRTYEIEIGNDSFIFNYAVDASWKFPAGNPPWTAPDDFLPVANRAEPWRIEITETENTLWNDGAGSGGSLNLLIDVYDWFNADLNTVRVESPGNFTIVESATTTGGGVGYSTYQVDIIGATPAAGEIELLISVITEEDDFGGFITGTNTTAYFTHSISVAVESPVTYHWEFDEITTFAGSYWYYPGSTEFFDISPALIEESDGDIALTWAGTDTNEIHSGYDSFFWLRRSVDNGVTYVYEKYGDSAGQGLRRTDRNKIAAGMQADAYAASCFTYSGSYLSCVEAGLSNKGVFVSYPTRDLETFVDATGYIYNFDDQGGNIKLKHSSAPNTLSPINWSLYPTYPVASGAYVSHVRSVGMDSSDVVWLAYYSNAETQVRLAHSTDASPHEAWDSSTVVYSNSSGISQVKNPSLWIDGNDTFHICYTRYDSSTGNYQLVYTKDDSTFDDPTEDVIVETSTAINDAHISVGEKFGEEIIILIYENNNSIYLITLVNGEPLDEPEEIDINTDDIDPDAILDADQCDFHSVWATMDGDNYDIARRNGVLVED